ncbi:AAA family ATPase [Geminocystis sp. NIES-3709]|uniref:AAA family ATPase n=1 Tax=Geminocystis sp. NIES-3709 TaxID=1617448 RepID=UPI0005FC76AE|nr:AAA family ATPase [Geminocystis sp. NIES-3709]BAQ66465.1 cardiolipin synthetase [Geminocystis sp. NIES-3709]
MTENNRIEIAFCNDYALLAKKTIAQYESEDQAKAKGEPHKIIIDYSGNIKVDRVLDKNGEKNFYLKYQDDYGNWHNKGLLENEKISIYPYKSFLLSSECCNGKYILVHEGEKACEYGLSRGIISTAILGSASGNLEKNIRVFDTLVQTFKSSKAKGIIYIADNDKTGKDKAIKFRELCTKHGIECLIVPIENIYPKANKGDDFADYSKSLPLTDNETLKDNFESYINDNYNDLKMIDFTPKVKQCSTITSINCKDVAQLQEDTRKQSALSKLRKLNPKTIDPKFTDDYFIIPDILPKGNMIQIIALPKVGKSLLAYDLIGSLINEEEFLGYKINQKNKNVLLIQCDETQAESDPRIAVRLGRFDERVNIINDFNLDDENIKDFEIWVDETKPSLILIDSLKSINNGTYNENDSSIAEPLLKMKKIAMDNDATIILIHHATKNKENKATAKSRGSTAIPALCHSTWVLDNVNDINGSERVKLSITGRCSPKKFLLEFDDQFHSFNLINDDPEIQNTVIENDLPVSKTLEKLIPELIKSGINTKKDLLIKTQANIKTLERAIRTLITNGKIERLGGKQKPYYVIKTDQEWINNGSNNGSDNGSIMDHPIDPFRQKTDHVPESIENSLNKTDQMDQEMDQGVCEEKTDQDSVCEKEYYVCLNNFNDDTNKEKNQKDCNEAIMLIRDELSVNHCTKIKKVQLQFINTLLGTKYKSFNQLTDSDIDRMFDYLKLDYRIAS